MAFGHVDADLDHAGGHEHVRFAARRRPSSPPASRFERQLAVDQLHAQVAELGRAQALVLDRRGPRLQRLGLLHQRTDDEALATVGDLLANALIRPAPRSLAVDDVPRGR